MKVLLLGANGQVGHELRRSLAPLGEVIAATRHGNATRSMPMADFDRPDTLATLIETIAPGVVVNAAAYTAVDKAEDDQAAAFRINAEAPGVIAQACARAGAKFVHYSTDYVFDGSADRPLREDEATSPLGVYGASKLAGEQAVRTAGASHLILRTAWVYGARGSNFMLTMLRLAAEREELRVVADQSGTPTPASLIADVTAELLLRHPEAHGTFHLTAAGGTNWHAFAEAIINRAHARGLLERKPRVTAIATADYPTRAKRPAYSRLDITRLQQQLGHALPDWSEGLDHVLDQWAEVRAT